MRRNMKLAAALLALLVSSFSLLGAGPDSGGLPPQPFLADYYSGRVLIQGALAPFGTTLVACVDDCQTGFQSAPVVVGAAGQYRLLELNPDNRALRGRDVTFYVVTPWGRIKAEQTAIFAGAYDLNQLELTFPDPLPAPPPAPELPAVGDPVVPLIPRYTLGFGVVVMGFGVLLLLRRRRTV